MGKPDVRYLEVGAYQGRSMMWMFKYVLTHPTSTATIVDIFYEPAADSYSQELRDRYDANIATVGATDRTETIVGFSQVVLREQPLDYYDIIYIDGSHAAPDVLEDAILSNRLLKEGGILIFDDYRWWIGSPRMMHTKTGVDTFLDFYGKNYELLHNAKQQQINEAQGQAEAILAVATATAEGLRRVATAVSQEGGEAAMRLRIAEDYVEQFGNLAKEANTLVVPANLSDISSMMALATNILAGDKGKPPATTVQG